MLLHISLSSWKCHKKMRSIRTYQVVCGERGYKKGVVFFSMHSSGHKICLCLTLGAAEKRTLVSGGLWPSLFDTSAPFVEASVPPSIPAMRVIWHWTESPSSVEKGGLVQKRMGGLSFIQPYSGVSVHSIDNKGGTEGKRGKILRHVTACFSHAQFSSIPALSSDINEILQVAPYLHMTRKCMPFVN